MLLKLDITNRRISHLVRVRHKTQHPITECSEIFSLRMAVFTFRYDHTATILQRQNPNVKISIHVRSVFNFDSMKYKRTPSQINWPVCGDSRLSIVCSFFVPRSASCTAVAGCVGIWFASWKVPNRHDKLTHVFAIRAQRPRSVPRFYFRQSYCFATITNYDRSFYVGSAPKRFRRCKNERTLVAQSWEISHHL